MQQSLLQKKGWYIGYIGYIGYIIEECGKGKKKGKDDLVFSRCLGAR